MPDDQITSTGGKMHFDIAGFRFPAERASSKTGDDQYTLLSSPEAGSGTHLSRYNGAFERLVLIIFWPSCL